MMRKIECLPPVARSGRGHESRMLAQRIRFFAVLLQNYSSRFGLGQACVGVWQQVGAPAPFPKNWLVENTEYLRLPDCRQLQS